MVVLHGLAKLDGATPASSMQLSSAALHPTTSFTDVCKAASKDVPSLLSDVKAFLLAAQVA